jgi:hypothetical protein
MIGDHRRSQFRLEACGRAIVDARFSRCRGHAARNVLGIEPLTAIAIETKIAAGFAMAIERAAVRVECYGDGVEVLGAW